MINSLKDALARRRFKTAIRPLLEETTTALNARYGQALGAFTFKPEDFNVSVWEYEGVRRIQLAAYWAFSLPEGERSVDFTVPLIASEVLDDVFTEDSTISPVFLQTYWSALADRLNAEFEMFFDFDMGRTAASAFLKPWETVRYDSYTPVSFRAYVTDECTGATVREAVVEYSPLGYDAEAGTLRAAVLHDTAVSTHTVLDFGALLAASGDSTVAIEWLRQAAEHDYIGEAMAPEVWFDANYGPQSYRAAGRMRSVMAASLGPVTATKLAGSVGGLIPA